MSHPIDVDIFCPHCAQRIDLEIGLASRRVRIAIALQADRFGTEIYCPGCGFGFVYSRLRPLRARHLRRLQFGRSEPRPGGDHRIHPKTSGGPPPADVGHDDKFIKSGDDDPRPRRKRKH